MTSDPTELTAAGTPASAAVSKSGGAWEAPTLRPATRWQGALVAAGAVLANLAVAYTLAGAAIYFTRQIRLFTPTGTAAVGVPLLLALAAAAVAGLVHLGQRVAFYRMERWRDRVRWATAAPGFASALAAKRAEPPKTPRPALERGR